MSTVNCAFRSLLSTTPEITSFIVQHIFPMASWTRLTCRPPSFFAWPHHLRSTITASMSTSSYSTSSHQPPWLRSLLDDQKPPPKLYAWTPTNVSTDALHHPSIEDDLDRRIFILGVGNLGRLYASYLSRHPKPPPITLVVHRKELLSQWLDSPGIEITRLGALDQNNNFQIEWWMETPPERGQVREVAGGKKLGNLIIATKAAVAIPEADRLRRYLDGSSAVAFLQNGMSKLWPPHGPAYISRRYPSGDGPNILACVTNHGVVSQGPFKSLHASPADASVGPVLLNDRQQQKQKHPAPSVAYLTEAIAAAPLLDSKSVSRADLWVLQLQKLIVNSTINPLTAVLRRKNGVLFENPDGAIAEVISRLLAESSRVLRAVVKHPSSAQILASSSPASQLDDQASSKASSLESIREQLTARFSQPQLRTMLYRIGEVVKENTSSMLQDVRAGKPTEVRDFNGWLVDIASFLQQDQPDLDLDVSCHRALIDLVEAGTTMTESELRDHLLSP